MQLLERVAFTQANIDEEAGVVRNVKILGEQSRNRRRYTAAAMTGAAQLYEGTGVNLDHRLTGDRQVTEAFGRLTGVGYDAKSKGLYGTLEYLKTHPYAQTFVELAKRMPEQVGFSHMAEGKVKQEQGETIVEQIVAVRSVDLVRTPATTKGLFESAGDLPEEQKQRLAFCERVLELVYDDSLSLKQLKEQLMSESKETPQETQTPPPSPPPAPPPTPAAESVQEIKQLKDQVTQLSESVAALTQQSQLLECLQTNRVDVLLLSEAQRTELRSKKTRAEMDSFAQSLPEAVKFGARPPLPARPSTPSSYDDARKRITSR
jgi:hypothetical protein